MNFPFFKLHLLTILITCFCITANNAQNAFDAKKPKQSKTKVSKANIEQLPTALNNWRANKNNQTNQAKKYKAFKTERITPLQFDKDVSVQKKPVLNILYDESPTSQTPFFITNKKPSYQKKLDTESAKLEAVYDFLNKEKATFKIENPVNEFKLIKSTTDVKHNSHFKFAQQYKGIDIWASSIVAHVNGSGVYALNGRYEASPKMLETKPNITKENALEIVMDDLEMHTTIMSKTTSAMLQKLVPHFQPVSELNILPKENEHVLVWKITYSPNLKEHWHYMINAHNGTIEKKYNDVCSFGPETAKADDLYGVERTINTYELNGDYYLIDGSRSNFKPPPTSDLPDDPVGAIVTLDLRNNPVDQFGDWLDKLQHVETSNNRWNNKTAVSAHYNAGKSYEYFKNTFNRNSIDGKGGTIWSVINVSDERGRPFDNAFWNGSAMFYGNGKDAFKDLPKALDAAAHEMSHGVIQNTANLIYEYQPGALNESFADIFGVMVDRDDWKIGEEVALRSAFPSGAMRDIQNPNNGARNGEVNKGWQPKNMNEYVNTNQDNGGVHINSGIPNRAFYLFATAVGKDVAEKVYYHALDNYLTQRSQFVDCRASVIQSSKDLYDNNVAAEAAKAFDGVGIRGEGVAGGSSGGSSTTSSDLPTGEGEVHFWVCDFEGYDITDIIEYATSYDYNVNKEELTKLGNRKSYPKGSITDDGSEVFFVGEDNHIYWVDLTAAEPANTIFQVSTSPNWRKVAISRDGRLLAALEIVKDCNENPLQYTEGCNNFVYIFKLEEDEITEKRFVLYNPSTANDTIRAGAPEYADAIEFEPNGEYLMYDAYNIISRTGGTEVGSWDIGIIKVWDNATGNYDDEGKILKLFPPQPSHVSIGNATFAKNSSYVIAFDRLDYDAQTSSVMAANLNTGDVKLIQEINSSMIGYPTFSPSDDAIAYSNFDDQYVVEFVNVSEDKITPVSNSKIEFSDGGWPVWFRQGERNWVKPTAEFSANVVEGPATLTINFTDRSKNLPNQWQWTFEGGQPATSNEQNPVVTFENPGTYKVTLKVSNPAGDDTESKNNYITVGEPVGIADDFLMQQINLSCQPNPFTDETVITFNLIKAEKIQLEIFDAAAKSILLLANEQKGTGNYQYKVEAAALSQGVYFYELRGDSFRVVNKMVKY